MQKYIFLVFYYLIFSHLPKSTVPLVGKPIRYLRGCCVKMIFKQCGKNINIESGSYFGNGFEITIGDYSGIGKNCRVPSNITIGNHVLMAEDVIILNQNHNFADIETPMEKQGYLPKTKLTIGSDVWIGTRVIVLPQVTEIGQGAIIGAGSVVTKNVPNYAVVGGNPAKVIKFRN